MKRYKVFFRILPKKEVLDIEGRAVKRKLQPSFLIDSCRIGKFVDMEIQAKDKEDASLKAKEMASKVFVNPLVEEFSFEVKPL